jgi:hypothetical protein
MSLVAQPTAMYKSHFIVFPKPFGAPQIGVFFHIENYLVGLKLININQNF